MCISVLNSNMLFSVYANIFLLVWLLMCTFAFCERGLPTVVCLEQGSAQSSLPKRRNGPSLLSDDWAALHSLAGNHRCRLWVLQRWVFWHCGNGYHWVLLYGTLTHRSHSPRMPQTWYTIGAKFAGVIYVCGLTLGRKKESLRDCFRIWWSVAVFDHGLAWQLSSLKEGMGVESKSVPCEFVGFTSSEFGTTS